ncbi:MAG: tetratricopeptide repeat protein [Bacteroidota bacterium]
MKTKVLSFLCLLSLMIFSCINQSEKNLKLGKEMLAKNNFSEAKKYVDEIIKDSTNKDSLLFEAYFLRGIINDSLKDQKQAYKDYSSALKLNKNCAECYYNIGMIYWWDSVNNVKAIEYFSEAIKINQNYSNAYIGRANAYYDLNEIENAITDFNKVVILYPDSFNGYFQRGIFYKNIGKKDSAIADFIMAVKFDKIYDKKADPYFFLIPLLFEKGSNEDAVKYLTLAIKKYPKSAEYYSKRGAIFYTLKRFNESINDLTKAIEIDSKDNMNYMIRALVYLELKQNDKACIDLHKAQSLNNKYVKDLIDENCK